MIRKSLLYYIPLLLLSILFPSLAFAEDEGESADSCLRIDVETQVSQSSGFTPLWLNANKYGLSSLEESNGYVRAAVERPMSGYADGKGKRLDYSFCADVAVAYGYTSTFVAQQAYAEARWLRGTATIGSKNWEMELKDNALSSGSQTLGKNARPVPQLRIGLDEYWPVPGTKEAVSIKTHISYGVMTDTRWQRDFAGGRSKHVEHGLYHDKAGYVRIGRKDQRLNLTLGLEMATMFGGTSHGIDSGDGVVAIHNESGLRAFWNAFLPLFDEGEVAEQGTSYRNKAGNTVGSWVARLDYKADDWTAGLYADHFFEDHSQMFFFAFNGYGTGDEWESRKKSRYYVYNFKDMMLGLELKSKRRRCVDALVMEFVYSKYQSGPLYHDHTNTIPDQISGNDDYYNNYIQSAYQHWGQVMGNPLYRSPLYNDDCKIDVQNNRMAAYHIGVGGHPAKAVDYRLLASFQDGMGTYTRPYEKYKRSFSLLAELNCRLPRNWLLTAAFGLDRGNILGNNTGVQFTARKTIYHK